MRRFAIPVLYATLLLLWCVLSHFAIVSNDVFPLRWQAEHLSFHNPSSFYDGFFPIGYPLLERCAAITGNTILTMMLLQIALASIYVFFVQRLLEKLVGAPAAFPALPLVLFGPQILTNVLSATPDFLAGFCVLLALWLLVRHRPTPESSSEIKSNQYLFAGIALGFGYLLRTHVIILVLALAIGIVLFERPRIRSSALLLLGTAPCVVLQGLIQVWSGHGFFQSSQAFNIWRMMHGSNWGAAHALVKTSTLDIIRSHPALFFTAWWDQVVSEWFYLIPAILAFILLLWDRQSRSQCRFAILLFATILYLVISTVGGSPRNVILIVPIVAAAVMFAIESGFRWVTLTIRIPAYSIGTVLWIAGIAGTIMFSLHAARRVRDYREVEHLLQVRSASDADHVFSGDFDLYFPDFHYGTPRTSGGWAEIGLPDYAARYPYIPDSSAVALHETLVREGIHWAVFRMPPYDERGYASASSDSSLFRLTYETSLHKIYRVE